MKNLGTIFHIIFSILIIIKFHLGEISWYEAMCLNILVLIAVFLGKIYNKIDKNDKS